MAFDVGIFLAALGITMLEFVEAAAVGLALYADSKKYIAFGAVAAGSIVVLIPTILLGALIGLLPHIYVLLVGGALMLYFGQRLVKSARRSVLYTRKGSKFTEHFEKGLLATGFSVGAIEAFEAAIVLVGLLPNEFGSTIEGMSLGIAVVVAATYILRNQVRKVKQANMKVLVSAILLSFCTFWFGEAATILADLPSLSDFVLIPLFAIFTFTVYKIANRPSPQITAAAPAAPTPATPAA